MKKISLIVAMDENNLIGSNNGLPWHLPADLAFFKRSTMGKPIIMGRKTFESIGKPLPGRRNIVVTRDPSFSAEDCDVANGIDAAIALCRDDEEVMLIGGANLYQQSFELVTDLYITRIHHEFDGDTWFPDFDESKWKIENRENFEADHCNPHAYSFTKFVREI